ncbi:dTDP-4-dehydrorhamnose reductase [Bacillus sp. FJAT-28004]|uniref:dTDP-4-dehydrorhamnose reductase n=1 Tax=Bacillus sp. FJAT-28004 TaxID=1679165 RepID=UPI0006B43B3A|nr:dTDP-4-dehydrorhamnose reductase [Bacillus sp. FJAT-28004]
MKILVTGRNGQLGFDVIREGQGRGFDIIGTGRSELDFTDYSAVQALISQIKPDAIIHCAAYTAVDKAESDKEECLKVNVQGTKNLATVARELGAKFMYVSTDYVFDGKGDVPFIESDLPKPVGYYGLTKYEGEQTVQNLVESSFIVRISWVFGINGNNFVKTMLRLAESRDQLNVVSDQYGSPTYTVDLAILLLDMIQTNKYGVYHASNEGFCSWADFSREIFEKSGKKVAVEGITTKEYPTPAVRPSNSRMSKQKLEDSGFRRLPLWQDALRRFLNELSLEVKE